MSCADTEVYVDVDIGFSVPLAAGPTCVWSSLHIDYVAHEFVFIVTYQYVCISMTLYKVLYSPSQPVSPNRSTTFNVLLFTYLITGFYVYLANAYFFISHPCTIGGQYLRTCMYTYAIHWAIRSMVHVCTRMQYIRQSGPWYMYYCAFMYCPVLATK